MSNSNILFVTADSIRADYCGFLGGPETTPYLSQLAPNSTIYETAISPGPRTPSSIALTHTGERFRNIEMSSNEDRLQRIADHIERFETIPERLAKQGYSTGAVAANPWTTGATGFDDDFDEFVEIGSGYGGDDDSASRSIVEKGFDYIEQWRKGTDWFAQWPSFYDDIQRLINSLTEPWFIWVFLMDTHSPYLVPRSHLVESNLATMYYSAVRYNASVMRGQDVSSLPPHLDEYLQRAYRDAIRSVDRFIQRVHEESPVDTSLIFHADHGEAFGEHGTYGHQEVLYPENIHVPLLIHTGEEHELVTHPVSTLKIPAIAEQIANESFKPQDHVADFAFSQTGDGASRAVRTASHWFIETGEEVLASNLRAGSEFAPIRDEEVEASVRDLFAAEFARDEEKAEITDALSQASIT